MNIVTEFMPISTDPPPMTGKVYIFNTTEELLQLPFVQDWSSRADFLHFRLSGCNLWAFTTGKARIIAEIGNPEEVDIPRTDYFRER